MKQHIVIPIIALFLLASISGWSQKKSDYLEAARNAENDKDYAEAARNYERVWQFNKKKTKYIYKAGEYYSLIKDFDKAEKAFENIVSTSKSAKEFPLARYHYANALKASGKYEQATAEYNSFLSASGKEADPYRDIIRNEIEGCDLALQMEEGDYEIRALDNINTKKFDFAPISVSNASVLYYSSAYNNTVRIFRATKDGDTWSKGAPLSALKGLKDQQICNGTFDESLNTFYFTICDLADDAWGKLTSRCEINAITKNSKGDWGAPKSISILNTSAATTTQPNFVSFDGTEYLFFASNREGGSGGMDIWYATKREGSAVDGFSAPRNLRAVNTPGDELTPFYSKIQQTIYFSSNGRPTIGGFDIFKAEGEPGSPGSVEHLSTPINSSTDDFYFYLNPDANSGLLVSNRSLSNNQRTTDEDIFEFVVGNTAKNMIVSGIIRGKDGKPAEDAVVELYEVKDDGTERFLSKTESNGLGKYEFVVLENRDYLLRANSNDLGQSKKSFSSEEGMAMQYDLILDADASNTNAIVNTAFSTTKDIQDNYSNISSTENVKHSVTQQTDRVRQETNAYAEKVNEAVVNTTSNTAFNNTSSSTINSVATNVKEVTEDNEGKKRKVISADFYAEKPIQQAQNQATSATTYSSTTYSSSAEGQPSTYQAYSSEAESFGNTYVSSSTSTSEYSTTYSQSSSTEDMTTYSSTSYDNANYSEHRPGVTYKIQVHAVKEFDGERPRYAKVRRLGRGIETETIGTHTRVLLAESFDTMDEALENLALMNEVGFSRARIVKFKNDVRQGFMPRF